MSFALTNARVLTPDGFVEGQAVLVDGDRIAAVMPTDQLGALKRVDLAGAMLVPGFIDTQVNGGGGALFNDEPTLETIETIAHAHSRFGTTGLLPTLISDDLDVIRAGIAAVENAIRQGVPGVLGIHIEGPFINPDRKGIHDDRYIRSLDEEAFEVLTSLKTGRTLATLAPERTSPTMISRLAAAGVRVSAGHTNTTYAGAKTAIEAGLTGFTHLFNAMSQLGNREPGAVGAALESDQVWCGLIVDGFHVDPATMKIALKCKGPERIMLVTDAMPTTGWDRDTFTLQGRLIKARDGRLVDERGTLAGSDLTMIDAVRNTVAMLGVPPRTAFEMASAPAARFLGLNGRYGRIAQGCAASLVCVDDDMNVRDVWVDGRPRS